MRSPSGANFLHSGARQRLLDLDCRVGAAVGRLGAVVLCYVAIEDHVRRLVHHMTPLARRVERLGVRSGVRSGVWGRLARASEAVAGHPVGRPLALGVPSCPEEAWEPSWVPAKGGTLPMLESVHEPAAAGARQLQDRDTPPSVAPVLVVDTLCQVQAGRRALLGASCLQRALARGGWHGGGGGVGQAAQHRERVAVSLSPSRTSRLR